MGIGRPLTPRSMAYYTLLALAYQNLLGEGRNADLHIGLRSFNTRNRARSEVRIVSPSLGLAVGVRVSVVPDIAHLKL
jgi:hypothetical protein